ncbi:hypothetical protein MAR_023268 [Mya arenaria]|uniref:Uncharacterized protein n=1 Tax=Mya arenaria TaxID=6604 RepID=A0ABY7DQE3_MYAAR|nr:hypothetical protein MAR_023268 [Mya arenaria]
MLPEDGDSCIDIIEREKAFTLVLVMITVERDQTKSSENRIYKTEDTHFFSCLYCVLIRSGFPLTLWIQTHLH